MVHKCCVCKIQSDDPDGSSVSYHKLPAREDMREEWLKVLKKNCPSLTRKKNLHVCSQHFEINCFQYSGMCQRRMLKSGSSPTIFPHFGVVECQEQGSNKSPESATEVQTTNVESSQVKNEFQLTERNIEIDSTSVVAIPNIETDSTGQRQAILNPIESYQIELETKMTNKIRLRDAKIRQLQRENKNLTIRLGRCRKKMYRYKYLFEALKQTKYISDSVYML